MATSEKSVAGRAVSINDGQPPFCFRAPTEGSPGSEHDATIIQMINDGYSWADIEKAVGDGAFDRYYDILDPDLVSLWTIDAIVRLNKVVREYNDPERSVTDASNEVSGARLDCVEDLPWDKIAEKMGFPSAGGCIYVWKSFGDGRPLPKKDNDDNKRDLEEDVDHKKAKRVANKRSRKPPLTEQVRRSGRRLPSTQQRSSTRSRNSNSMNPTHSDLNPTTHTRKVSLDELPSVDRRAAMPSTRSQVQLQKLIDTKKLLQELSMARLQEQERRRRELGGFLEGVAFCKRQRDSLYKGTKHKPIRTEMRGGLRLGPLTSISPSPLPQKRHRRVPTTISEPLKTSTFSRSDNGRVDGEVHGHAIGLGDSSKRQKADVSKPATTSIFIGLINDDTNQVSISEPTKLQLALPNASQNTGRGYKNQAWTAEDAIKIWKARQQVGDDWEYISQLTLGGKHSPNACRNFVLGNESG